MTKVEEYHNRVKYFQGMHFYVCFTEIVIWSNLCSRLIILICSKYSADIKWNIFHRNSQKTHHKKELKLNREYFSYSWRLTKKLHRSIHWLILKIVSVKYFCFIPGMRVHQNISNDFLIYELFVSNHLGNFRNSS